MDGTHVETDALERILAGQAEPDSLDLQLLRHITGNFSDDRRIGKGGCGEVYKGTLPNGVDVAVKRLFSYHTIDEKMFLREVRSMIKVGHQNIVRFLGYCSETKEKAVEHDGKPVMAEKRQRLLCFEYIRKGCLDNYLTDELRGLDWQTRYQIIKGICDGLLHLHKEKHILHMDLKPANILLDDQMLPKITDFGLATIDGNSQTTSAHHMFSELYGAPEYIFNGKRSPKADIYSLGVIIIELVTGSREMPNTIKVLRRWRHRWNKSSKHTPLWYHQVKKCLELAVRCKEKDPINRPYIWDIMSELSEIENWDEDQIKAATESSLDTIISGLDDMLGIEPLEFQFHLDQKKQISCSIELTNDTDDFFAFRIVTTSLLAFSIRPNKGIVAPQTKCRATIALPAQEMSLLQDHCREEIIVQSTKVGGLTAVDITADLFMDEGGNSQKQIDGVDKIVDKVTLVINMQLLRDEHCQETAKASGEPNPSTVMGSSLEVQPSMEMLTRLGHKGSRYIEVLESTIDGRESPSRLPLSLLEDITENFSDERRIGSGGIGAVYKGILGNHIVAVKRLFNSRTIENTMFEQAIIAMMTAKHQNIVRLLGYCSHTEEEAFNPTGGKLVVAEVRERLLCFEYVSNGSLDQHLTDELRGLEWQTRYQIILGICEGLQYLHKEKHILHLCIKPSHILLGDGMVPKITDFCLSRLDEESRNMSLSSRLVSPGYYAPEYMTDGKMSAKSDIYALGVLIRELVTGRKEVANINNVLRRWRHRWNKSGKYTPGWHRQVTKCLELASRCMQEDPTQRPFIWDIIHELEESDQINFCLDSDDMLGMDSDDMLGIEPLEIHFPSVLYTQQSRSIQLTNDTDHYVAFRIMSKSISELSMQPDKDVVPPRSMYNVTITLQANEEEEEYRRKNEIIVESTRVDEGVTATDISQDMFNEENGKVIDRVDVKIIFDWQ